MVDNLLGREMVDNLLGRDPGVPWRMSTSGIGRFLRIAWGPSKEDLQILL